jgi:hypothetical protein
MFRRGRCGRQVLGVFGRASLAARLCSSCLPVKSLGRDRPSIWSSRSSAARLRGRSRRGSPAGRRRRRRPAAARGPGGGSSAKVLAQLRQQPQFYERGSRKTDTRVLGKKGWEHKPHHLRRPLGGWGLMESPVKGGLVCCGLIRRVRLSRSERAMIPTIIWHLRCLQFDVTDPTSVAGPCQLDGGEVRAGLYKGSTCCRHRRSTTACLPDRPLILLVHQPRA